MLPFIQSRIPEEVNKMKWVSPVNHQILSFHNGLLSDSERNYEIIYPQIPDLRYPPKLNIQDALTRDFYQNRVEDYDRNIHLTFQTYNENENEVRNKMVDLLEINNESKVLEIGCGTGRDSSIIASRLGKKGEIFLTDISEGMVKFTHDKLIKTKCNKNYCVSNAMYIPCPDNYFDAVYSFGSLGEFSDPQRFFSEITRVCKVGAKVVVGDENLPTWQRKTTFGKVLANYNKQFLSDVPFEYLPIEAREVKCQWVIGGVFYLIDFRVGNGEPNAKFEFEIPGVRGGTHNTRYYGQLEGVTAETKELAFRAREILGISMHKWLDQLISNEAKKIIGKK
jgi:ubiquinone/menaquinone biosynthesis C-methylase UbiE